jgi:tRNA-Thr(GGU) m(6)t(6)A37 methyltransferase TsaA
MEPIILEPIGIIRTPYKKKAGTPVQPSYAGDEIAEIEIFEPYVPGLKDLEGFERIWLLYLFDRSRTWKPLVVPFRDVVERGVFATRAPSRPCPIGLSVVELVDVKGGRIRFRRADMLDRTPLLDIKPYVPSFEAHPGSRAGWLDLVARDTRRADDRFDD